MSIVEEFFNTINTKYDDNSNGCYFNSNYEQFEKVGRIKGVPIALAYHEYKYYVFELDQIGAIFKFREARSDINSYIETLKQISEQDIKPLSTYLAISKDYIFSLHRNRPEILVMKIKKVNMFDCGLSTLEGGFTFDWCEENFHSDCWETYDQSFLGTYKRQYRRVSVPRTRLSSIVSETKQFFNTIITSTYGGKVEKVFVFGKNGNVRIYTRPYRTNTNFVQTGVTLSDVDIPEEWFDE